MEKIFRIVKIWLLKRLFSDFEVYLYETSRIANRNKVRSWYLKNFILPVCIILTPLVFGFFLPGLNIEPKAVLMNGSLTVLGFSMLFSTSSYLIRSKIESQDESNEETEYSSNARIKLNETLSNLRDKSLSYLYVLVIAGWVFYSIQIVSNEYEIAHPEFFIPLILFLLVLSISFSHFVFNLSDDFIDKTMEWKYIYERLEDDDRKTEELMNQVNNLMS